METAELQKLHKQALEKIAALELDLSREKTGADNLSSKIAEIAARENYGIALGDVIEFKKNSWEADVIRAKVTRIYTYHHDIIGRDISEINPNSECVRILKNGKLGRHCTCHNLARAKKVE